MICWFRRRETFLRDNKIPPVKIKNLLSVLNTDEIHIYDCVVSDGLGST